MDILWTFYDFFNDGLLVVPIVIGRQETVNEMKCS